MSRFDRITLAAVVALAAAVGALSVASARLGPSVDSVVTAPAFGGVSVNTQVGLTFTEPMNPRSVESGFSVTPRTAGSFEWIGNELLFVPSRSLRYATTYTVRIDGVASARSGRRLARPFETRFTTETQHLLYLGTSGHDRGKLLLASIAGSRTVVGNGDGSITDFSVSFDGSLATYVRHGGSGERADEIWVVSLADGSSTRLFRKPDWNMSQPHFSPDGKTIVFLATNVLICQKYYGCYRDKTGPVIYLYDLETQHVRPFQSSTDTPLTDFISYSPAGQLAFTDLGSALTLADPSGGSVIHVPNGSNSLEFSGFDPTGQLAAFVGQTPSSSGGDILVYDRGKYHDVTHGIYDSSSPAFSASGSEIAYSAYRGELGIEPVYGINVYNLRTKRTRRITWEHRWSDWSPAWSNDGSYITFVRSAPQEAMYMGSGEIWVARSDGSGPRPLGGVGEDPTWVG